MKSRQSALNHLLFLLILLDHTHKLLLAQLPRPLKPHPGLEVKDILVLNIKEKLSEGVRNVLLRNEAPCLELFEGFVAPDEVFFINAVHG